MRRLLLLLSLLLVSSFTGTVALAQDWQIVGTLPWRGSAAYFFNADEGVVGTGAYNFGNTARIYTTTNGGATWDMALLPNQNIQGQVTDIFFRDRQNGWATIAESSLSGWAGLYGTTDGGRNWKLIRQAAFPCGVRQTSRGLFFTDRGVSGTGIIFSPDNGTTFTVSAVNSAPLGIDFIDDLRGFVTAEGIGSGPHMITTDGGSTWNTVTNQAEAWGVAGDARSGNFVYAMEKNSTRPYFESAIEVRRPNGTIDRRWSGKDLAISGGIQAWKGCDPVYYVQGQGGAGGVFGLMRSTDGGMTWVNVGGPTNGSDTRFAVTGRGAVVYAFDGSGNILKTTTGGDGKLRATVKQDIKFSLVNLSAIQARECDSITVPIALTLPLCDSARVVSVEVLEDRQNVLFPLGFSGRFIGSTTARDTIRLRYRPERTGDESILVRIRLQQRDGYFEDTIITINAKGLPAEERYAVSDLTGTKTIDFGKLNICSGDSSRIITLRNTGCGDLRVQNISIGASAFELRSRIAPLTLGPGDERKYLIRFRPRTLGPHNAWIVFQTRDGKDSINLTGEGIPGTRGITISQSQITATTCDTIDVKIRLHNTSCGEIDIAGLSIPQPLQVVGFSNTIVPSDSTIDVTLRYAPSTTGNQTLTLAIDATIGGISTRHSA
jgi:hypothetical protein